MNPCEVGLVCPYCVTSDDDLDVSLCCTYPILLVPNHWVRNEIDFVYERVCPLVEEGSELKDWLQVMDDPTVQLAIEKANSVRVRQSVEMLDNLPYGCEWKDEDKE